MSRWSVPPEVHGHGRFLMERRGFAPAYLKAHEEGRLKEKVEEALSHLGPSCRVARFRHHLLLLVQSPLRLLSEL